MITSINALVAAEHRADLRRSAERRRWLESPPLPSSSRRVDPRAVELRLAHGDETHLVRRLADLDDAPGLEGPALLALIDGEAVAALSLRDGRVVANPFLHTGEAVALLRLRAGDPSRERRRRRVQAVLRARFA